MLYQSSEEQTAGGGDIPRRVRTSRAVHTPASRSQAGRSEAALPRVPDSLWVKLEPLIQRADPPAVVGRRRTNQRHVLDAILYRLITGCPWNELPASFPHPSAVYRTYRRWLRSQLMDEIVQMILVSAQRPQVEQRR
jgi:hypothetical protein